MKRLSERDYDVLEVLQTEPQGLRFGDLLDRTNKPVMVLNTILKKLQRHNFAGMIEDNGKAAFKILDHNDKAIIMKVCCPVCKTIKRVYNEKQESTACRNKDCKNEGGWHRQYWIISQHYQKKGILKRINLAQ